MGSHEKVCGSSISSVIGKFVWMRTLPINALVPIATKITDANRVLLTNNANQTERTTINKTTI